MKFRVVILATLMLGSVAAHAVADISGVPKIIDGNRFYRSDRIRLHDICPRKRSGLP